MQAKEEWLNKKCAETEKLQNADVIGRCKKKIFQKIAKFIKCEICKIYKKKGTIIVEKVKILQ